MKNKEMLFLTFAPQNFETRKQNKNKVAYL